MAREYLDQSDIIRLEAAASNPRDGLLIHLLFRLGCRVSELLAISLGDVDLDAKSLTIIHLKARISLSCSQCGTKLGLRHDYCPACGAKTETSASSRSEKRKMRVLPVDDDTVRMIREYIDECRAIARNGKIYLFGITRHRAWQIVRECAAKAGLSALRNPETGRPRGVSPHRLRDAFAVVAMKNDDSGDGMRMLQEHLGHASFNTTARYRKVAVEEHRAWYGKLWTPES